VAAVYRCIPAPRGQVRYWQIVEATGLTPKQVSWAIRALRNQRLIRPYGRRNLKRTFGRKGYHAWTRRTAAAPAPKHLYGYPGLGKSCLALPIDPTLVVAEGVMARYAGALKELAR
jgi:hypothetical protein